MSVIYADIDHLCQNLTHICKIEPMVMLTLIIFTSIVQCGHKINAKMDHAADNRSTLHRH